MKELTLDITNSANFNSVLTNFLKKFASMDKSILIKLQNDKITATMSNFEKSVIKYAESDITDVVSIQDPIDGALYLPLVTADKLTKILGFFGGTDLQLKIAYDNIDNKNVALNLKFENSNLSMELGCSKLSLFKISIKVTDEILDQLSNTTNNLYEIDATSDIINKIKNLSGTNLNEEMYLLSNENGVIFKGDAFEYKITETNGVQNSYGFLKSNIKNVDTDEYKLHVMDDKIIFKSVTNNTIVIIAKLVQ